MKKKIVYVFLICLLVLSGCSSKIKYNSIENIELLENENHFSCEYESVAHDFIIALPENINEETALILMLPGYGGSATSIQNDIHFEEEALNRNYAVCYVSGAPDESDATSGAGWNYGIASSTKDDVGFLISLSKYLEENYKVGQKNKFIAGFSNGAVMTYRIAAEADVYFTAVVSVGGKMPAKIWDKKSQKLDIGVFQINGTKDDVVPMKMNGTNKHMKDPAIEDVIEYFAKANNLNSIESIEDIESKTKLIKYSDEKQKNTVWQLIIEDGRHSWPQNDLIILDFMDTYK